MLFVLQHLQIHDDQLMRMLDMYTEAQFLQHSALRLDHLCFQIRVVLIQHHGRNFSAKEVKINVKYQMKAIYCLNLLLSAHLLDVMKDVDDIANATRRLFNFGGKADTAHGHGFHVVTDEAL